ncbi:MAG: hypothetical protein J1F42_14380 [Lachnospiraceae bacterium]|nr:hypothetical protein [Lachnospiraceae bacterium]
MQEESFEDLVIGLKNNYKTGTYGNLYSGVYVKEILYEFRETLLFGGKLGIMLPLVFEDMPEHIAQMKYPSRNRPQVIKTNHDGSINCCFSLLDQQVSEKEIAETAAVMKDTLKKVQPWDTFLEEGTDRNHTNVFSWFTYKNYSIDSQIFNHMFVTAVDGRALIGMFNCPYRDMQLWKDVMMSMMLTLNDKTGE